jgi:hypothetical protein
MVKNQYASALLGASAFARSYGAAGSSWGRYNGDVAMVIQL